MPKRALSVTLTEDNLVWLRSRTRTTRSRGLSETLDRLINEARLHAGGSNEAARSVVGTVDIGPEDPALDQADEHLRRLFATSLEDAPRSRQSSNAKRRTSERG